MVSYTINKGLSLPLPTGDAGIWGGELNTGVMGMLDLMLGGYDPISLSATTYTLNATEIQNLGIKCTGLLIANIIVYSSCVGSYYVENNCTGVYPLTWQANFGSGGVGTAWNIPQGSRTMFVSDTTAGARPVSGDVFDSWRNAGRIDQFAGSTAPFGSVLCYGQAISRALYPYLYVAIGTTYGVGDGSTTFNVPDYRGRTSFGLDNMGGTPAGRLTGSDTGNIASPTTLGSTGGEENHTVLTAEMPTHTHTATVTDPTHGHSWTDPDGCQSGGAPGGGNNGATRQTNLSATGISVSNANAGGGGAHNTTPPAMVCNWIIKT